MGVLIVNSAKCTGCRICEQWCAWQHHGAVNPARSRITINRVHQHFQSVQVVCAQCPQAPCIDACPTGAISRDPITGGLILDEACCAGCRLCLESCVQGCIKFDTEREVPLLCDLCGGDPQCVRHCPEGALRYLEPNKTGSSSTQVPVRENGDGKKSMAQAMGGLAGTILRVNLSDGAIRREPTPVALFERFLGARGVGAYWLFQELGRGVDPLGPANKLIFLTGPLAGTLAPGASRIAVTFRSPLSGTYSFSLCGGHLASECKFAGYDGIVIEGRAERPVYLCIDDGHVELRPAGHLWGRTTHETEDAIRAELGDTRVRVAVIGPAGEKLVRFACIQSDYHREFGRGGAGAVMGSKNLKAIAVRGTGQVAVADPPALASIAEAVYAALAAHPKAQARRIYGTPEMIEGTQRLGYWATRNFAGGHFEGAEPLMPQRLKEALYTGDNSCYGCPVACGKVSPVTRGPFANTSIEGAEFETIGLLGPNCGIGDPAIIVAATALCDAYGFDTMSAGVTVSMAMEAYQRGLIGPDDTGGIDLCFGNGDALLAILEQIACRRGLGDLLAEGSLVAARKLGAPELAMQTKGMELPTYEPRGVVGMGLSYAISPKGGHHMIAPTMGAETGGDPAWRLEAEGKAALVRGTQLIMAVVDSLALCSTMRFVIGPAMMQALYRAVTGRSLTEAQAQLAGERIANLERLFNLREGLGRKDDSLPRRLLEEPMPDGPSAGSRVPLQAMLDEYYVLMGWDAAGVPTPAKMRELGLEAEARCALDRQG